MQTESFNTILPVGYFQVNNHKNVWILYLFFEQTG